MEAPCIPDDVLWRVVYTVHSVIRSGGNPLGLTGPFFSELAEQLEEEYAFPPVATQELVSGIWLELLSNGMGE